MVKNCTPGVVIPIGGAERKLKNPIILEKFVRLCGQGSKIVVIPTASRYKDAGEAYCEYFTNMGAGLVEVLPIRTQKDCARPEIREKLKNADGLFFTGGDQKRLQRIIGKTALASFIRQRHLEGLHIAGTSAGAAFMSDYMIAGGKTGATPRSNIVQMSRGLGLLPTVIVDQHFRQRNRLGRLLTALSMHPDLNGLGIDENSAAFIYPDDTLEMVGSGVVTIIDTSDLELPANVLAAIDQGKQPRLMSMANIKMHMLTAGARFNMITNQVTLPD